VKIFIYHDLRIWSSLDSRISQISDFGASQVHDSRASQVHDSRASQVHDSRTSQVTIILKWTVVSHEEARFGCLFRTLPKNLKSTQKPVRFPMQTSRFHETGIIIPMMIHELISRISENPTFRGCKVFPRFHNTSPLGKQVDSDDPISRISLNSSKKCHPRNVGVDTCPPDFSQQSYRGSFLKLPPRPYK
jgi:hypothetical protein